MWNPKIVSIICLSLLFLFLVLRETHTHKFYLVCFILSPDRTKNVSLCTQTTVSRRRWKSEFEKVVCFYFYFSSANTVSLYWRTRAHSSHLKNHSLSFSVMNAIVVVIIIAIYHNDNYYYKRIAVNNKNVCCKLDYRSNNRRDANTFVRRAKKKPSEKQQRSAQK